MRWNNTENIVQVEGSFTINSNFVW